MRHSSSLIKLMGALLLLRIIMTPFLINYNNFWVKSEELCYFI